MPNTYENILAHVLDHPWAITRPMLGMVANILARHLAATDVRPPEAFERRATGVPTATRGGVAVIPLHGVMAARMNLMSDISGGATYEQAGAALAEAMAAPDIGSIVLDWDSPGGSAAGAGELARKVLEARSKKPIVSVANFQMASAAYWIGACATEIVAAPSAMVGSIGVYTLHEDLSAALDKMGVKLTYISAGKYKVDGNEAEPLSDTARARLKAVVDDAYGRFVASVSKGRGVSEAAIRSGYGEGNVLTADEALAAGMVDRIDTLEDTVARLLSSPPRSGFAAAQTPQEPTQATGATGRELQTMEMAFHSLGF